MENALSNSLLALVNNYVKAIRFILFWLRENVPNPEEKGVISTTHKGLYTRLREGYNLPSKVAEDCYRDALSVYKAWYNDSRKGRFPRYSSVSCLKCGQRMIEVSHRWFKCSCGYENDHDVIAIMNLNGRGSLTLSTAPQMRDVNPNR
ncbi:zinc ribbon domain-containing protein [Stygiolobus sp. CP850M]